MKSLPCRFRAAGTVIRRWRHLPKSTNKTARRSCAGAPVCSTWCSFLPFSDWSRGWSHLQLIQGERYTFLSENNRVRIKRVPGTRGMIFDRQGQLLVDSRPSFDLIFVPEDTGDPENTLRLLAQLYKVGRD